MIFFLQLVPSHISVYFFFTQNTTNQPPQCASWNFDLERMYSVELYIAVSRVAVTPV